MNHSNELQAIEKRLIALEKEKEILLNRQRILLEQIKPPSSSEVQLSEFSTAEKIVIFQRLFIGRMDIFATRWENTRGRSGYSVACHNEWAPGICQKPVVKCSECAHRNFKNINQQEIYGHLSGKKIIGLYPLLQDSSCHFLAFDLDKSDWQQAVLAIAERCHQLDISHAIERSRSGKGAHLWIFFESAVPAKDARLLGSKLLDLAMETHPGLSFESYDRLFPNQDFMPNGGFGNLIALPLQFVPRQSGNSVFIDDTFKPHSNQWLFLQQLKKLSSQKLYSLIQKSTIPSIEAQPKPWEKTLPIEHTKLSDCPKTLVLVLANQLYIPMTSLPALLITRLKRLASFANPAFYKAQAMRFSTQGTPRYICCARFEDDYLILPRGCLDDVVLLLEEQGIHIEYNDQRYAGAGIEGIQFLGCLKKNQIEAVNALLKFDTGTLHAPTAFGKTVTAIGLIAQRKTNTLILVHSRQLLDQWKERLSAFVSGVSIGVIGGGKCKPSNEIDIATYQSFIRRKSGEMDPLLLKYGQIIVDECHHVSAPSFELILSEVRAKYVLGLTATPERQDGHQRIIFMQTGAIRHHAKADSTQLLEQKAIIRQLHATPPLELGLANANPHIANVYAWLMQSNSRNLQIVDDVVMETNHGRNPLVLTERREHATLLSELLTNLGFEVVVLRGGMKAKERHAAEEGLKTAKIIIATGKYIGEGFDLPRLDTLFLAMPISWKGSLAQYAGRIHRQMSGKDRVTIYDYVDTSLPMLQRMFQRRAKGYDAMGYTAIYNQATDRVQTQLSV
jgi:superfamily II DNA or RNA helicase